MYESSNKILVIEDDNVTRDLYLKGLKAKGFDTISADNALLVFNKQKSIYPT